MVCEGPAKDLVILPASEDHLAEITDIYNDAVLNSTASFDSVAKTLTEKRVWLGEHGENHPVVVAELCGEIAGWGGLSPYHERACYHSTVEDSVYVSKCYRRKGIGTRILEDLIDRAKDSGHHAIIARIDGKNEASINLHNNFGFQKVGILREIGYKFGMWLDVVVMELIIS